MNDATNAIITENAFQMNLLRIAGNSLTVSFEHMLEFLLYINNQSIAELQFIEQQYLASIFNHQELESTCSLQELSNLFENAKNKNDIQLLKFIRETHRQAISFVNEPEIKLKLQEIAQQRKTQKEYQAYNAILLSIIEFVKLYPHNQQVIANLTNILPQLFDNLKFIEKDVKRRSSVMFPMVPNSSKKFKQSDIE